MTQRRQRGKRRVKVLYYRGQCQAAGAKVAGASWSHAGESIGKSKIRQLPMCPGTLPTLLPEKSLEKFTAWNIRTLLDKDTSSVPCVFVEYEGQSMPILMTYESGEGASSLRYN